MEGSTPRARLKNEKNEVSEIKNRFLFGKILVLRDSLSSRLSLDETAVYNNFIYKTSTCTYTYST